MLITLTKNRMPSKLVHKGNTVTDTLIVLPDKTTAIFERRVFFFVLTISATTYTTFYGIYL